MILPVAAPLPGALLLATLAGLAIPVGAALARLERFLPGWLETELRHSVIAFGGGALFSAIALVLVPEGSLRLHPFPAICWFGAGGLIFFFLDRKLSAHGGSAAQFMAMVLDYLPEAMALGSLIAGDPAVALLMAGLIALQNLPEGFNAYREIEESGKLRGGRLMALFLLMVPLGPAAAAMGLLVLDDQPEVLGAVMLFSAGGILYLIFEDVAPQVRLETTWGPPLGAVAGFMLGLAGALYT
ncbi:divalent cation transporter [Aquicoccus sp. SCR17]|nr:divalent cation transporter [Carideicomes alvinocaridis]